MDLPNLEEIGNQMFSDCSNLCDMKLSGLPKLRKIGKFFAYGSALEDFQLSELPELQTVGDNFLGQCAPMRRVSIVGLPKLKSLGNAAFANSQRLRQIVMRDLPSLEMVGVGFGKQCGKVEEVQLLGLPELTSLEKEFLSECSYVKRLSIHDAPKLQEIKDFALKKFPKLHVELDHVPKLRLDGMPDQNIAEELPPEEPHEEVASSPLESALKKKPRLEPKRRRK